MILEIKENQNQLQRKIKEIINERLKMMIIMRNKIKKFNRMILNNKQNHKLIIRRMIMITKLTDYDKRMKMKKIKICKLQNKKVIINKIIRQMKLKLLNKRKVNNKHQLKIMMHKRNNQFKIG